jgi:hypothetical protein
MGQIMATVAVAAFLAGCGTGSPQRPLACKEEDITPIILDYGGGPGGYATDELAARSITKNGQVVEITSRSDHESTFVIETSDGKALANATVIERDDQWWVDFLTTCDLSGVNL